jgi:DNA repair exonuclease SbcCD ATPase subunit
MDLDAVADELYGLPPGEFTAARNEQVAAARHAGDRALADQIKALRRPTIAAWASNLLVRKHKDEVEPLIRLGDALRRAHRELDGEQLRTLNRQQHTLVSALARQARQLAAEAGQPVGDNVVREIEELLRAVLADPAAAKEWAAGRLAKPISAPIGFAVATDATTATTPAPPVDLAGKRTERDRQNRRARIAAARREAEAAARELAEATQRQAAAGRALDDARTRVRQSQQHVADLSDQLRQAEEAQRAARETAKQARDQLRDSDHAVRIAGRKADDTAATAERLAQQEP